MLNIGEKEKESSLIRPYGVSFCNFVMCAEEKMEGLWAVSKKNEQKKTIYICRVC